MVIVKLQNGEYMKLTQHQKDLLDINGCLPVGADAKNKENLYERLYRIISDNKEKGITAGVLYNRVRRDRDFFNEALDKLIERGLVKHHDFVHKYNGRLSRLLFPVK